jgi:hypothetical protein
MGGGESQSGTVFHTDERNRNAERRKSPAVSRGEPPVLLRAEEVSGTFGGRRRVSCLPSSSYQVNRISAAINSRRPDFRTQ